MLAVILVFPQTGMAQAADTLEAAWVLESAQYDQGVRRAPALNDDSATVPAQALRGGVGAEGAPLMQPGIGQVRGESAARASEVPSPKAPGAATVCVRGHIDPHENREELLWLFPPAWLFLIPVQIAQAMANASYESCLREQRRELAATMRQQMAREGEDYLVKIPRYRAVSGVEATVDKIRRAGYSVGVDDDAQYLLLGQEGTLNEDQAEVVLRKIMTGEYVVNRRRAMTEEGGDHILFPRNKGLYGATATVQEINASGYAVKMTDMGHYQLVGRGGILTGEEEIAPVLRLIRDAKRAETFAREGENLEVSFCPYGAVNGELYRQQCESRATLKRFKQTGYDVSVNQEGKYSAVDMRTGQQVEAAGILADFLRQFHPRAAP